MRLLLNIVVTGLIILGSASETKQQLHRLPIQNHSDIAVEIIDWSFSCNCTSVTPRQFTVPAGKTVEVELKIDLTHRLPNEMDRAQRAFSVQLRPKLKSVPSFKSTWLMHGAVKSRVTLDADFLQFGELPMQGQRSVKRRVVATTHIPTAWLEVRNDQSVVNVQVQRRDDGRFELSFMPNPRLPAGEFRTDVHVDIVTPVGERFAGVIRPVAGTMQPEVRLLPARVFLGSHPVGSTVYGYVVMQGPAEASFHVDRIETDTMSVFATGSQVNGVAPGCTFRITQMIREFGDHTSTLRFFIGKGAEPPKMVIVEVTYRGEFKE